MHPAGTYLIKQERERQITELGYDAEHDDQHQAGEILVGALHLAEHVLAEDMFEKRDWLDEPEYTWPWPDNKPDYTVPAVRRLTIAGAMIAAEIDRINRAIVRGAEIAAGIEPTK